MTCPTSRALKTFLSFFFFLEKVPLLVEFAFKMVIGQDKSVFHVLVIGAGPSSLMREFLRETLTYPTY